MRTPLGEYRTHSVLLAIGRRGTPRKLDVPGEEQPKVVYRLIDPQQYAGQKVLVVGGGDSAIEAAIAICEVDGTAVTLSYRGKAFDRAKAKNRERIESARRAGRVNVLLNSTVRADRKVLGRSHLPEQGARSGKRERHRQRRRHAADGFSASRRHRDRDQVWNDVKWHTSGSQGCS